MIKYIFSNLDGTLLNQDGQLSEKDIAAVKASPLPISLISARSPQEMQATIDQLALTTPQVAFNGGVNLSTDRSFPNSFSRISTCNLCCRNINCRITI